MWTDETHAHKMPSLNNCHESVHFIVEHMLLFFVISMHSLCVHLHIHTYRLTAMLSTIVLKLKFNYNNHVKLAHACN